MEVTDIVSGNGEKNGSKATDEKIVAETHIITQEIHDASICLEEYMYYASITRDEELRTRDTLPAAQEQSTISDAEWSQAARAARTATWSAVFFLVTADIMGPYSVPWAMAQLGYGPGITLYVVFGVLAGWTGYLLWRMFLQLDSNRYPLKTYGDIAFRIYGSWARHSVNALQTLQILFNVGVIIIGNAQGLSEVVKGKVCFSVLCLIWAIAGALIGQVRTLRKLSYFTNLNLWMNLGVMAMTMGVVSRTAPYYSAAIASNGVTMGPVVKTVGVPASSTFETQLVGLMQAVYSFGGSMLFCEFMSEMRRPMDFWKALVLAQAVILVVYLTFGVFVYSFQGQFSINPAGQGISNYAWQTAVNVIGMVATLIAGALYGNIGLKVIYQNAIKGLLNGPELNSKRGKIIWAALVPIYWSFAFIIASAIPQFSNVTGIVGAACILQFTYTFPSLLQLGFDIQKHAVLHGEVFDPVIGRVERLDHGWKRWVRGARKQWYYKLVLLVFFLGSAATAVLGIYSSITAIVAAFTGVNAVTGFGCTSPLGG